MLIDFHAHCFPDALAGRAIAALAERSGLAPCFEGTVSGFKALMERERVDGAVLLNIATNERQQGRVNDFAIAVQLGEPKLHAFGSVHPKAPDFEAELLRLKGAGIRGVKLHPDYIATFADAPELDPIYEQAAALGLCVVLHAGWDFVSPNLIYATPERILNVTKRHKTLNLIAAHLGGFRQWAGAEALLAGQNLYLDTSFAFGEIEPEQARRILQKHDENRLLFGSDAPWLSPKKSFEGLDSLHFPGAWMEKVCSGNALRLLEEGTKKGTRCILKRERSS
ncbi:MAG: amidohydrolase family protein [Christensenellaceae bacterium]|jgi:predicted TIM-barrel fold metal-dependent hydrolase|nr:amidohydrolase family protein [Christensenellaceae bacterium]